MWAGRRPRPGPITPGAVLAALGIAAWALPAGAQSLIDPCSELPPATVEAVLAAGGIRASVTEAIPMASDAFGTCDYRFADGSLRLQLLARADQSAEDLARLFQMTPRPGDAVTLEGLGDEAFRYVAPGTNGVSFRAGPLHGTVTLTGRAPGLDAAVVELGRRWLASRTGVDRPVIVAGARRGSEAAAAPEPAAPSGRASSETPSRDADHAASDDGAPDADLIPDCAPGAVGRCVPDEATHLALAITEAIEDGEPERLVPIIHDAVLAAGFSVLEADGSVTPPRILPSQGIAVHVRELEDVAKLVERGASFPLDTVAASLATLFEVKDAGPIAGLLLEGIRRQAASERESSRTWARLIAALGLQRQGIDLLGSVAAAQVEVDALQLLLVMRRLTADLAAASEARSSLQRLPGAQSSFGAQGSGAYLGTGPVGAGPFDARPWAGRPTFHLAAFAPGGPRPALRFEGAAAPARAVVLPHPSPIALRRCAPDESAAYIMDWAAIGITTAFSGIGSYPGLLGVLQEGLSGKAAQMAGTYGKYLGAANHVLALTKLILTFSSIEVELEMLGDGPLVRTRDATPGERRTVRATLNMDIDDAEAFNCTRLGLNQVGLDFSVPNGGPMKGVETHWRIEEGGVQVGTGGEVDYGIVQFAAGQLTERRFTDASGRATITIEGKPQRRLSPSPREVMKHATLGLEVKLKPNDLIKDLPDIAGAALAGPGAPIAAALEMVYRSRVPVKGLRFPVRDWTDRLRFRITRVGDLGAGGLCYDARGITGEGTYRESYDVTVDHEGSVVVARRNVQTCSAIESTAEGADHAQCKLTGSYEGRLTLDGLYWAQTTDPYMLNGRPTRKALKITFDRRPGAQASVSSNCEELDESNWRNELTSDFAAEFPPIPEGATSVRSLDGSYLLEVLEGDLHTFRVK